MRDAAVEATRTSEQDKPATDQAAGGEPQKAATERGTDRDPGRPVTAHAATTTETAPGADVPGRLGRRMEHAIGGFVDDPRRAVREADDVLEGAIKHLARVVENRRTALRTRCRDGADTEELRVALTRYRDLTGQLLAL